MKPNPHRHSATAPARPTPNATRRTSAPARGVPRGATVMSEQRVDERRDARGLADQQQDATSSSMTTNGISHHSFRPTGTGTARRSVRAAGDVPGGLIC